MTDPVNRAAAAIKAGLLVAFPTETVYGLGADATGDAAVARVFAAKGRPMFNPLIVHVGSWADAERLGTLGHDARKLARAFWPGSLTLVVPRARDCPISLLATAGQPTIALRVPRHPVAMALIAAAGRPLVAPSANPSGRLSPTTAEHVRVGLADEVAVVLDGGPCPVGIESTIVGCFDEPPLLLRPGGLPRADIEATLGRPLIDPPTSELRRAPGRLPSHYAPRARLRLEAASREPGEGFLGFGEMSIGPYNLSPRGDVAEAAANLFRMLHELDGTGAETIAVAPIPDHGLGEAINDRLRRAAAPRP